MSFTEKAKIIDRGSICSAPERTGSELQCEPFLCSVACSKTELSFQQNFGRTVKGSFTVKLKSLIVVPLAHLKVRVLSFNMNLISSPYPVPRRSYSLGGNLGDRENCRSPKKLKSLIEVPYVAHLKVQVLSFNVNLFSSP